MSGLPLISRRRLLTAMALSPLLWQMNTAHAAAIDPNRIVALEWLPVELLLALGIVPYGVADTINYRLWVSEPPLPDSVIDVNRTMEKSTIRGCSACSMRWDIRAGSVVNINLVASPKKGLAGLTPGANSLNP